MSDIVAEIKGQVGRDGAAEWISNEWDRLHQNRQGKLDEWTELRNFLFATDTLTTTAGKQPWQHTQTTPKLCQIRDNLHANYESSLFPNDRWLSWVAYSKDTAQKDKAKIIKAYMDNKTRESNFRTTLSQLLYDYIDYGNAFAMTTFETRYKELADGTRVAGYIGPKVIRVSPLDIVFNSRAADFAGTYHIVRSIKTIGELHKLAETEPGQSFWKDALDNRMKIRKVMGGYKHEDFEKVVGFELDGFGNMYDYFQSNYVEVLEFYGDYYDNDSGELSAGKVITVVDRWMVARQEDIPSWFGGSPIRHVGWRFRPDNLWAMGPLDNLVGMQFRLDHIQNAKSDAMDLIIDPPLKVIGEVEEFELSPRSMIHIDENGDVSEFLKNVQGILTGNSEVELLMQLMEELAGAPREAAGIRTPGEKTALEVQTLSNAAGRIFQNKINNFEINMLEPLLNDMLEISARSLEDSDLIRVLDTDEGVQQFLTITKEDITANGKLRPIGARHFAKQAQDLQNLVGIMNSPIYDKIAPHTSGKQLTELVNDITGLTGYTIFRPNVAIEEQQETQSLINQAEEDLNASGGEVI